MLINHAVAHRMAFTQTLLLLGYHKRKHSKVLALLTDLETSDEGMSKRDVKDKTSCS